MPISPVTVASTFSGNLANGWTSPETGHTWTFSGVTAKENNGRAILVSGANTGLSTARIQLPQKGVPEQTNDTVLMRFNTSSLLQWPLTDFGPMLSYKSGNTFYYLNLQGNYAEVAIGVFINGYRYELNRIPFNFSKDIIYWVRFQRHGSGLRGRIWKETEVEPQAWTITSGLWGGSYPPTVGSPGVYKKGTRDAYDISIHDFYYYAENPSHPTTLAADTFSKNVTEGFGVSSSGHVWEGQVSTSPFSLRTFADSRGFVTTTDGGSVNLRDTSSISGLLGPEISGNIESVSKFLIGGGEGTARFHLGLRGRQLEFLGAVLTYGVFVEVIQGSSTMNIIHRSNPFIGDTVLATGPMPITIDINVEYWIKIQIFNGTVRARCWPVSASEPTSWMVTGTDTGSAAGALWFSTRHTASSFRRVYVRSIAYQTPTLDPAVVRNFTTTGDILSTPSDTTASFTAQRTDDVNSNGTVSVKYKPTTASSWITFGGTVTKSGNNHNFSITGLQPGTSYNIQVTWQDADGVQGANPKETIFTTTTNSILPKDISVTGATTTSLTVEATYDRDTDSDSTAVVAYRKTSGQTYVVEDYFVDENDDELLQNTESLRGGTWVRHPQSTGSTQGVVSNMKVYSNALTRNDKLLYRHSQTTATAEYDVVGEFLAASMNGTSGVAFHMSASSETYYGAGINASESRWELFKMVSGTKTVLATTPFTHSIGSIHKLQVQVRTGYKAVLLNGTEILRTTDSSINSSPYYVGWYSYNIEEGNKSNQFLLETFIFTYRTPTGSWSSDLALTMDRANRKGTRTITGLTENTIYELRVTFTDADGVTGSNTLLTTAQTVGASTQLVAMGASTSSTSAVVDVFYNYDTNNNAYIEFQYRSTMEYLWTTVPFTNIRTDRTMKKFSVTMVSLTPGLTYEAKVKIVDPDGILENTPETLSGLFTTDGADTIDKRQTKHYIWKVYDPEDNYLGTIPDAPEPEFSLHQNGGVTDLSFDLNRKMSELDSEAFIAFQNRVDIWAIDPSSDGMGPNTIPDPDADISVGAWTHSPISSYDPKGGPDGGSALKIQTEGSEEHETISNTVDVDGGIPLVISCTAKASGAKLRMYVRSYTLNDVAIDSSPEIIDTVGTGWQRLKIRYIPPRDTAYIRVIIRNTGRGLMFADKFSVLAQEVLVYRGRVESFTPEVTEDGEKVRVEVLGLASLLSDDYIEFLQFVEVQPQKDVEAGRLNYGAADPADIMKKIIDAAKAANPFFSLYYTTDSIRYTGNLVQYTFRDQQIRNCMDKVRSLCPAGWHYYIEPDGLVVLRSQEQATTHTLRLGVEILRFSVERSIRNLKNYVRVKGRQDEDRTETDGHGSINYIAFNQASIDKYGKRTVFVRDAQITDPETARLVGDGRLEEYNREEQRVECYIPDNKLFENMTGILRGYNIESFRPCDLIIIIDPVAGSRKTYWNKFRWDIDTWDTSEVFRPLPEPVPIITIQNHGSYAQLELSERPPSQVGDFSRLYRWMAQKETE